MYLGIDIGGTKTLVASLDDQGNITEKVKFPTVKDYPQFLEDLEQNAKGLKAQNFRYCAVGIPASAIDRDKGIGLRFGNLPWRDAPVRDDAKRLFDCPAVIENDAKLAGLSEAKLLKDEYRSVLYITVSTGIGFAVVVDGVIDTDIGDGGGRTLLAEHEGKMMPWEDFASGRAIVERFGMKAKDITDKAVWQQICRDLAKGLIQLVSLAQPEIIVVGGSVGVYFERYGELLAEELGRYDLPLVSMPKLLGAKRPEEAVIYGCYELIKQSGSDSDG